MLMKNKAPNAEKQTSNQPTFKVTVKGPIMKNSLIAIAAVVAAAGAFAGEADPSGQFAMKISGQRTRAEVAAEAATAVAAGNTSPSAISASSKVLPQVKSSIDSAARRAQAVEAVRLGQVGYGEQGRI